MTTFAAVLCLFGFVLVPAAPAWAGLNSNNINYERCTQIKAKKGDIKKAKEGRDCYKTVAAQAIKEQKQICKRINNNGYMDENGDLMLLPVRVRDDLGFGIC